MLVICFSRIINQHVVELPTAPPGEKQPSKIRFASDAVCDFLSAITGFGVGSDPVVIVEYSPGESPAITPFTAMIFVGAPFDLKLRSSDFAPHETQRHVAAAIAAVLIANACIIMSFDCIISAPDFTPRTDERLACCRAALNERREGYPRARAVIHKTLRLPNPLSIA